MSRFITLDPAENSTQDNYKLLIGSVVPRPIAFVSTQSPQGQLNLAPYSFFTGVCSNPPTILFCPMVRGSDGQKKDTLLNIEATGEFVVNVVNEAIVSQMNQTAAELPHGVSEFTEAGLTPTPSIIVKPPRVLESPLSMECKLQQVVYVGDGSLGSGSVVMGTVVRFHVREDLYHAGRIDTALMQPVARLAGAAYCPVRDMFEVQRPS
ncbi:flavin reductase family protein [Vampirovibrio sp.]|uniref:flavin reductase family protein n=1 Tax=Vampirovibrio sp. TaxID=2717857 RepID=UPI0035933418